MVFSSTGLFLAFWFSNSNLFRFSYRRDAPRKSPVRDDFARSREDSFHHWENAFRNREDSFRRWIDLFFDRKHCFDKKSGIFRDRKHCFFDKKHSFHDWAHASPRRKQSFHRITKPL